MPPAANGLLRVEVDYSEWQGAQSAEWSNHTVDQHRSDNYKECARPADRGSSAERVQRHVQLLATVGRNGPILHTEEEELE